jgi:hypothetical protein
MKNKTVENLRHLDIFNVRNVAFNFISGRPSINAEDGQQQKISLCK